MRVLSFVCIIFGWGDTANMNSKVRLCIVAMFVAFSALASAQDLNLQGNTKFATFDLSLARR